MISVGSFEPATFSHLNRKAVATIVGQTCEDMAALALIAYEENCDEMDRLLKAQQCFCWMLKT